MSQFVIYMHSGGVSASVPSAGGGVTGSPSASSSSSNGDGKFARRVELGGVSSGIGPTPDDGTRLGRRKIGAEIFLLCNVGFIAPLLGSIGTLR